MSSNCDLRDVITSEDRKGKQMFGKRALTFHEYYDLWDEETNEFNEKNIRTMYMRFIYNMIICQEFFKPKWVSPEKLLYASKGLVWDWTSDEEREQLKKDIGANGVYFPIFTLDQGLLHNQIGLHRSEENYLRRRMLYNSYNGNHRIDVIQELHKEGCKKFRSVLIYIIPEFCEKSCTGFKYTPIDDREECFLKSYKLPKQIMLFHLNRTEDFMKVKNWRFSQEIDEGVSSVLVDDYNIAFRIMTEFQNLLEPVLINYYKEKGNLDFIKPLMRYFNDERSFNKKFRRELFPEWVQNMWR